MRYTKTDVDCIIGKATVTGYDFSRDADEMGQNFHAQDDSAYSIVKLSELSDIAQESILTEVGKELPKGFQLDEIEIKFKWNVEWGDWSDVLYNGDHATQFLSGLPFSWLGAGWNDYDIAEIVEVA